MNVALVLMAIPLVLSHVLPLGPRARRVAFLDVLPRFPPIVVDVAIVLPDVPAVPVDVAGVVADVPLVLGRVCGLRGDRGGCRDGKREDGEEHCGVSHTASWCGSARSTLISVTR